MGRRSFGKRPDYNSGIIDGSYEYVKQVQQLLYDGKYDEAVALLPHLTGATDGFGAYQLLCDMMLTFSNIDETQATDYTRTLDLDNSVFTTQLHIRALFIRERLLQIILQMLYALS